MNRRSTAQINFTLLFVLCCASQTLADEVQQRTVRMALMENDSVRQYEVVIEKEEDGTYRELRREFTEPFSVEPSVVFNLPPGTYRYSVIPYDLLNHPSSSTAWKTFEITALVPGDTETDDVEDLVIVDYTDEIETASEESPLVVEADKPAENETITGTVAKETAGLQGDQQVLVEGVVDTEEESETIPRYWRFTSLGVSLGTTFAAPLIIGTVRGTISSGPYSFVEIGADIGIGSAKVGMGYTSLYPYARISLFLPFIKGVDWYIGAGGGCMIAAYEFPEGEISTYTLTTDFATGFCIKDFIDVSYSLRKNSKWVNHKISVGYVHWFSKGAKR